MRTEREVIKGPALQERAIKMLISLNLYSTKSVFIWQAHEYSNKFSTDERIRHVCCNSDTERGMKMAT